MEHLKEIFSPLGPITSRKMFGGHGIYHNGLMFGLIADDTLYLKVDKASIHYFEERQLGAFEYDKKGKVMKMSYHLAPEEIMDSATQAELWGQRAYDAARRSYKPKKPK
ncbi:TfoX/Sxy family protein [Romeriopsis navalis]|uniref:TfoX/Sxy family protein n=1 Tax=Romeriopsis navalis TaxID=2992132 RepID=UPI0021F81519|nr:TfoX/Sxy family protein [Romeriopsis navalis]